MLDLICFSMQSNFIWNSQLDGQRKIYTPETTFGTTWLNTSYWKDQWWREKELVSVLAYPKKWKKSWRQPEWFEEEKESEDKHGESEKLREKNGGRRTNIAQNWRMCFLVRNPSLKLAKDVNSTTFLTLCVQMKKRAMEKTRNKYKRENSYLNCIMMIFTMGVL